MKKQTKKPTRITSRNADKHLLYERSVQDVDSDVEFIDRAYRKLRGRAPTILREDFCGTALLLAAWIKNRKQRRGIGIDNDASVLAWGKKHNLAPLGEPGHQINLYRQDVRKPVRGRADIITAFNFSYGVFKTRLAMREYLAQARKGLRPGGMIILDTYGGWESQEPLKEKHRIKGGVTYVWDQASFDPITHRVVNHIHFQFPNGRTRRRAFTYDWRYWTLPELQELLQEAGYSRAVVYWDVSDDDDDTSYRLRTHAENQPGWLAYVVGLR